MLGQVTKNLAGLSNWIALLRHQKARHPAEVNMTSATDKMEIETAL